jgi:hypothetical protein
LRFLLLVYICFAVWYPIIKRGGGVETPLTCLIRPPICSCHQANQVLWTPIVVYYGSLGTKQQSLNQSFMIRTLICLAFRDCRGCDRMVVGFIICNQCLSSLTLWVVLDTTLCDKVCQWLATGLWFSLCTPVSSTNKTDRHDITEILLKVTLNTIIQTLNLSCFISIVWLNKRNNCRLLINMCWLWISSKTDLNLFLLNDTAVYWFQSKCQTI